VDGVANRSVHVVSKQGDSHCDGQGRQRSAEVVPASRIKPVNWIGTGVQVPMKRVWVECRARKWVHPNESSHSRIKPACAVVVEAAVRIVRLTREGVGLLVRSRVGEEFTEGGVGVAVRDGASFAR